METTQIIINIKTKPEWKEIFSKILFWDNTRKQIDYVNKCNCTQEDIDNYNLANENFLHYFDQIGITYTQYQEVISLTSNYSTD